jgi:uroporphyrinogen decarboxylase
MNEIMEIAKGKRAISGNLDPIEVLWKGTPEKIEKDVERLMKICKPYGQYIFSPGEMNPRQVPEENMDAMMKTAKKLSEY